MECTFDIPVSAPKEEIYNKAKAAVEKAGGVLNGTADNGSFAIKTPFGGVEGNYSIASNMLHIEVSEKPFFISCGQIEDILKKALA